MPDFEALNALRSQTLREIRDMVSEEAALWGRYSDGRNTSDRRISDRNTSEMIAGIERNRQRFRALWQRHEKLRQEMMDAGFMPPRQVEDPTPANLVQDSVFLQTEERLQAEVESARREYQFASQEFRLFLAAGTGLPAPDGNLRASQIASSHSAALRKYTGSIRRFNTFLADRGPADE